MMRQCVRFPRIFNVINPWISSGKKQQALIANKRIMSTITDGENLEPLHVSFFDTRPYWIEAFEEMRSTTKREVIVNYVNARLSEKTAVLAKGSRIACIFVNDAAQADTLRVLKDAGVTLLALRCAGFNNVDIAAAEELGISVVRVPAYSPHAVAEFALTLLMALNRKIARSYNRTRSGNFSLSGLIGMDIFGKTVGVIGTGKIGSCFVRIMTGMGCTVLCEDAYHNPELVALPGVRYVSLQELLAQSDIISMHAPLNPSTDHLINDTTIAAMKRGVILINTSRGKLIDTKCLIRGLKSGQVGAAGLDVLEGESQYFFNDHSDENLEDEDILRLLSFNNVIVTSHQSFLTREALHNIAATTVFNAKEHITEGKSMRQLTNHVFPPLSLPDDAATISTSTAGAAVGGIGEGKGGNIVHGTQAT